MGLGSAVVAVAMVVSLFGLSSAEDGDYGSVTVSGGFEAGNFGDVWDLTDGDITISFTYDANGMVDDASAHAWAELGVRSAVSTMDFNPYIETYAEESFDLFAAQDIDVGDVIVQRVGDTLYVTFLILEDGWSMIETHLDVRDAQTKIPQTKTGSPIPGKFTHKMYHDPPVTEYEYIVDVSCYDPSLPLYIAAHAHVQHVAEVCAPVVVSDDSVMWSADETPYAHAVPCYVHPNWPGIEGATWIWRTALTDPQAEYASVPDGGWWFNKSISVPLGAFDIVATVQACADNGEALYVNGALIFSDGSMDKDGPDLREWSTVESADISEQVIPGENMLVFRALNYFNTGDAYSNPAGLVFKATVCYKIVDMQESAWAGTEPFPSANWAKCIVYDPGEPTISGSGVWLATDYDWTVGTFDPDPEGAPTLDLDDKLILQRWGGQGEGAYDLPSVPPAPGNNHRFWWDRDGVDPWQNAATANTGGVYQIVITLHATSATTGTAYMSINGLYQGFETDSNWNTIELTPAGMTWVGDMHQLVVFYGIFGYGATHSATFSNIVVSQ